MKTKKTRPSHPDFPTRAAEVFKSSIGAVKHGGVSVELQPFTIRRVALLHSVWSPLFYREPEYGPGVGWMVTTFIMAVDAAEASQVLATQGIAGLIMEALNWCDAMQDYELCALCALAIRDAWQRIETLDPPDMLGEEDAKGDLGNA